MALLEGLEERYYGEYLEAIGCEYQYTNRGILYANGIRQEQEEEYWKMPDGSIISISYRWRGQPQYDFPDELYQGLKEFVKMAKNEIDIEKLRRRIEDTLHKSDPEVIFGVAHFLGLSIE